MRFFVVRPMIAFKRLKPQYLDAEFCRVRVAFQNAYSLLALLETSSWTNTFRNRSKTGKLRLPLQLHVILE